MGKETRDCIGNLENVIVELNNLLKESKKKSLDLNNFEFYSSGGKEYLLIEKFGFMDSLFTSFMFSINEILCLLKDLKETQKAFNILNSEYNQPYQLDNTGMLKPVFNNIPINNTRVDAVMIRYDIENIDRIDDFFVNLNHNMHKYIKIYNGFYCFVYSDKNLKALNKTNISDDEKHIRLNDNHAIIYSHKEKDFFLIDINKMPYVF